MVSIQEKIASHFDINEGALDTIQMEEFARAVQGGIRCDSKNETMEF